MATELFRIILQGAESLAGRASQALAGAIESKGREQFFEFPDTAYHLPVIYALTGLPVRTIGDMETALGRTREMLTGIIERHPDSPTLGDAAEAGLTSLFAAELLLSISTLQGQDAKARPDSSYAYQGFIPDTIMRTLGVQLVDGTIPGIAALIGAAPDDATAVRVVRELQEKGILTLIAGRGQGVSIADQLERSGVEFGWESRIVVLGPDALHVFFAVSWAIRASLIYGNVKPGSLIEHLAFQRERVPAFVIAMGAPDAELLALGAGAIAFGFPVISDQDVPTLVAEGVCPNEALTGVTDYEKIVRRAIEVRNLKIVVAKPPVPVPYGPAFEGERVRKENTFLEFGGQRSPAFEWVRMRGLDDIEDNKVIVIGKDREERLKKGGVLPLGILVEVAGRKMQKDFEGVIERKLHSNINEAHGVWHMGQREIVWARISNEANQAGFILEHFGIIHAAMIHNRFGAIVDKVQVTIYIDEADVTAVCNEARTDWVERDLRLKGLTDESVDTFFSCLLCQSFAPNHVCVISPERLGLCGAFNWLDAKAAFEIDPTGGNQPIIKGELLDENYGRYAGIDGYLKKASRDTIETLNMYTIMENPMTSCGCFECIVAIVPEANGVMIVHRGFADMTPVGMKFSTLAASVGGGVQTPGFMGIGINFIASPKFIKGDGGIKRIVWMTTEIKDRIRDAFNRRAEEEGVPDLLDRIADETICEDSEKLLEYMSGVVHPALEMPQLLA
jgi:acetyl-CoA synthase